MHFAENKVNLKGILGVDTCLRRYDSPFIHFGDAECQGVGYDGGIIGETFTFL
ncbi:MAG TPA: hypothetical protein VLL52_12370 [Anaerolineae bacterium]|nr:hypothetical protein [Anaerolineae bacterium]